MATLHIYRRLKASTLVEVLVALVIITLVTAIAATFFARIGLNRPDNLVNLQLGLKALAAEAKRNGHYRAEQFDLDNGVRIDMEVKPYQNDTLLLLLELKAHKQGTGEIAVYREIIIKGQ